MQPVTDIQNVCVFVMVPFGKVSWGKKKELIRILQMGLQKRNNFTSDNCWSTIGELSGEKGKS